MPSHSTSFRRYVFFLGILFIVASVLSLSLGWPIGFVALALFIGWPVIGTMMTIDDDLPGGWSNPGGNSIPEWKTLQWHIDLLLCRGALVVLAFAIQFHPDLPLSGALLLVAFAMSLIGFRFMAKSISSA